MKKAIIIFLILLSYYSAKSQDTDYYQGSSTNNDSIVIKNRALEPKYGLFVRYNYNLHSTDFRKLPDVSCCSPKFSVGYGPGMIFGALLDYFFLPDYLLSIRASYGTFNGLLTKEETTNGIADGKSIPVFFEHSIDATVSSLALEPLFGYKINDNIFSYAGFRLGYVTKSQFSQIEKITKPSDRGVFVEEGTRTRNQFSGEIPNASSFQFSINAGISYELPLKSDSSLILSPELFYSYWLTDVAQDLKWNIHTFSAGLALKYKQPPPPPPPPPPPALAPYPPFPDIPSEPPLALSVKAVQLDSNNTIQNGFDIQIEDFVSYNMRPLLNYIFFEHNSYIIPHKYKQLTPLETKSFNLSKLHSLDVLPTYYHVLNIIGKRLSENPDTKIVIVGTNSGSNEEKNNIELSKNRALAVRDYLNRTWSIPDKQMEVSFRNLPKEASNMDETGGEEENRRVEILSDNFSITEPVMTVDTLRHIKTTTLRFLPEIVSAAGVSRWKLTAKQGDSTIKEFSGASTLPSELNWLVSTNAPDAPTSKEPITYSFSAQDNFGKSASTPAASIPVFKLTIDQKRQNRIEDREYEYYSLILFDFGKSSLEKEHRRVLDFIKNRIKPSSTVTIYGYTDRIGDSEVNKKLSERRAREVASKLGIKNAQVAGIGEEELLYNNDLPEGRFYCRTVRITIETPIIDNGN